MLLMISPLFLLYFRLTHSLPAPSYLKLITRSSKGLKVTTTHWALMNGLYMFLRDNFAVWAFIAVQNLTGPRSTSAAASTSSAAVAAAVSAASLTMALVDQCTQRSKSHKEGATDGVLVYAADLTAYLSVAVLSLILCLAWLAAQNIALAMVLAVHIVPATCITVAAAYRLGVITLCYNLSPRPLSASTSSVLASVTILPTTPLEQSGTQTRSPAAEKTEERGGDILTNTPHDQAIDHIKPNHTDIDIVPVSREVSSSLLHAKGFGEDAVLDSNSDKKGDSVRAIKFKGVTSISSSTILHPKCRLISTAPSQTVSTLCHCVMLLFLLLCSPAVVPSMVFRYKAMFLSHSHTQTHTSATYFAALANDWAHPEVMCYLITVYPSAIILSTRL